MKSLQIPKGIESLKRIPNILKEDPIIRVFDEETKRILEENIAYKVLFGSRARLDSKEYSDYDFLILIQNNKENARNQIEDIGADILYNYNILISCLIWELSDWDLKSKFPIGMNILKEGILL